MNTIQDELRLTIDEIEALVLDVLGANGFSPDQAGAIARTMVPAETDECRSHGVYRLLGYVRSVAAGKADGRAEPVVSSLSPIIVRVDGKHGFAPLAAERGRPALLEAVRTHGMAALVINDVLHNSALWADLEPIVEAGFAAIAITAGQSGVAPHGGSKPVFGTDPFAFGWPRSGKHPLIFDFATSAIARGEIELHRRAGKPIPLGWAVDSDGNPTTDPDAALAGAMLPFGGYKGTALALMVELMAGPMINDLISSEALAVDNGAGSAPLGGELILVFDPDRFSGGTAATNQQRAELLLSAVTNQPGARLPGSRRYVARRRSEENGVLVPRTLYAELLALAGRIENS